MTEEPLEIEPFLIFEEQAGRFATWRIADNDSEALAMFREPSAAAAYRETASLGAGWRDLQPDRRQLAAIVQAALDAGLRYAVLDPDGASARRIFQLQPMQEAIQQLLEPD